MYPGREFKEAAKSAISQQTNDSIYEVEFMFLDDGNFIRVYFHYQLLNKFTGVFSFLVLLKTNIL